MEPLAPIADGGRAAEDHAHHFVLSVPPTLTADVSPGMGVARVPGKSGEQRYGAAMMAKRAGHIRSFDGLFDEGLNHDKVAHVYYNHRFGAGWSCRRCVCRLGRGVWRRAVRHAVEERQGLARIIHELRFIRYNLFEKESTSNLPRTRCFNEVRRVTWPFAPRL